MSDTRNVLVLNYEFPPLGGGASPVSKELAEGYVESGARVTVVTMHYKGLLSHEIIDGVRVFRVPSLRFYKERCSPVEQFTYLISAFLFLRKHLRTHLFDICHCHFIIPTGVLAFVLNKIYKIPYIITAHGSDVPGYNTDRFTLLHRFTKPLIRLISKNARLIISPSEYLACLISQVLGNNALKIIPNGIDPNKFTPQNKKKIILSTGRLLKRKGFQHLIEAVSEEDLGYEVHIAGDGPMKDELHDLAKKSKTKIIFHGWVDNTSSQYKNLLETASVYVLASERENASISLLEAMSAGCAIITTNVSGCPETVGDAGLLIDPGNVVSLSQKLSDLTSNEQEIKKIGALARERLVSKFSWKAIIDQYNSELYVKN